MDEVNELQGVPLDTNEIANIIQNVMKQKETTVSRINYFTWRDFEKVVHVHEPENLTTFVHTHDRRSVTINLNAIKWEYYNYDSMYKTGYSLTPGVIAIRSEDLNFRIITEDYGDGESSIQKFQGRVHAYIRTCDKVLFSFCIINDSNRSVVDWQPLVIESDGSVTIPANGSLTKCAR